MICLWVNKRDWLHPGPILTVGLQNAYSLAANGIKTHLCCGVGEASDTARELGEFYGLPPSENLTIHRLEARQWLIPGKGPGFYLQACALAKRLAAGDRVAVLTRDPGFLPYLWWLCRNRRIRGFYEAHNFLADLSWREDSPGWAERRDGWMEKLWLPRLSGLVAITSKQRELYARVFPRLASCALPLGTWPREVSATEMERRRGLRTLVYVGHLHGFKGVGRLLNIAAKMSTRWGLKVLFVGGAPQQLERFRGVAAGLESTGAVRFRPFVSPRELGEILGSGASVGAALLRDTFYNRYLTCPAKALDYLSHGLPVVATDLPSTREVLGGAGIYVGPRQGLLGALVDLLEDPGAYATAVGAAMARAREMSWEGRARRLAGFIEGRFEGDGGPVAI